MYDRILIPLDGSSCSEATVEHGLGLARLCGAEVTFLHVRVGGETPQGPESQAEQALERALEGARAVGIEADKLVVDDKHPAEAILRIEEDYDLIVIGTHGRHGADRLVLGSVSEAVTRHSAKPHLVLRCPADGAFDLVDHYRHVKSDDA